MRQGQKRTHAAFYRPLRKYPLGWGAVLPRKN
jgi:hypothetical protein